MTARQQAPRSLLYLCSNRWNSAITEYCLNSAEAVARAGHLVHLACLEGSPCAQRAAGLGLAAVIPLPDFRWYRLWRIAAIAKERVVSNIIAFGGPEAALASVVGKSGLTGGAKAIRFRGQELPPKEAGLAWRRIAWSSRSVPTLFASDLQRRTFVERTGSREAKFLALPVDPRRFFREPSHSAVDRSEPPYILAVARFDPVKGFAQLFEHFAALRRALPVATPSPRLLIVGREENLLEGELHTLATSQGLTAGKDYEIRTGFQPDIRMLMSRAVCGFVSSLGSEVICRVAEEFLCCGTPVIVSGVGSLEEALLRPDWGISYRGLATGLAEALAGFCARASTESEAARQARAKEAEDCFGYHRHQVELLEWVRQVGERRGQP